MLIFHPVHNTLPITFGVHTPVFDCNPICELVEASMLGRIINMWYAQVEKHTAGQDVGAGEYL